MVGGVVVQPPLKDGVKGLFLHHADALHGDVPLPYTGDGFVKIQCLHLRNRWNQWLPKVILAAKVRPRSVSAATQISSSFSKDTTTDRVSPWRLSPAK